MAEGQAAGSEALTASVPAASVPTGTVVRRTFMPSVTCSGSGSMLVRLPRTLVPSQSTIAETNGTGMPGAASDTMVKARTVALGGDVDGLNSVPKQEAHTFATVEVARTTRGALVGDQVRPGTQLEVLDEGDLFRHVRDSRQ